MEIPFGSEKKYPCCSSDVIILNEKNEVLLTRRGVEPFKNSWILPGGRIKQESPVDAAVREVYEEIGVTVEIDRLYGVYTSEGKDPRGGRITIAFVGHIVKGTPQKTLEVLDTLYFAKDELPNDIGFHHKDILDEFFKYPEGQIIHKK
ncbi:DNA mismatch repair protein MutT [Candidatus Parcubacteria bacterium]|nr:MAG: DNA mismatch repair protein MutT [Candidatus Parcubacteria bacterium]